MFFIIKKLILKNFGIHEQLELSFDTPVTVIVGSNGIGKTTLIDALSLTLGGVSERYPKIKDLPKYIGSYGEKAEATVILDNTANSNLIYPLIIRSGYKKNEVAITLHLNKDRVYWKINNVNKQHPRQFIRDILQEAVIQISMTNELIYTRKDTVDKFMSGSPAEQFQQLLKPLDLESNQLEILEVQEKIDELKKKKPDLEYRRTVLKRELEAAKEKKEQYELKLQLQDEKKKQQQVLRWAEYLREEEELKELEKQYKLLQDELNTLEDELKVNQDLHTKAIRAVDNNSEKTTLVKTRLSELKQLESKRFRTHVRLLENKAQLKAGIKVKERSLLDLKERLANYQEDLKDGEKKGLYLTKEEWEKQLPIMAKKERELESLRLEGESDLYDVTRKLTALGVKIKRYTMEKDALIKKQEVKEENKEIRGKKFNNEERHTLSLWRALEKTSLKNNVTKPLFQEVFLKEGNGEWEGAINHALGSLRSYLLVDGEKETNDLHMFMKKGGYSVWTAKLPMPLLPPARDLKSVPDLLKKHVFGWLEDFIEIDNPRVAAFLLKRRKVLFANSGVPATELLQLAKHAKADVYTSTPSVFKPDDRFRTNLYSSLSLGTRTDNLEELAKLQDELEEVTRKISELSSEKLGLLEKKTFLQDKQAEKQAQIAAIKITIDEFAKKDPSQWLKWIKETQTRINEIETELATEQAELKSIDESLTELLGEKYIAEIDSLEEKLAELRNKSSTLKAERIVTEQTLTNSKEAYLQSEHRCTKHLVILNQQKKRVEQAGRFTEGEKPLDVPPNTIITRRIAEIDGKLSNITANAQDLKDYKRKKANYESLEDQIQRLDQTFSELRRQLSNSFIIWKQKIRNNLQEIQDVSNYLLDPLIELRCSTEKSENVKEIELKIEFRTKSSTFKMYKVASGGEQAIITQAVFLALHSIDSNSPIHIVDEFTQRFDESYRGHAFHMVKRLLDHLKKGDKCETDGKKRQWNIIPQIILVAPTVMGSLIPEDFDISYLLNVVTLSTKNERNR